MENGGALNASVLSLETNGFLTGHGGFVNADVVNVSGTVGPGSSAGTLNISGDNFPEGDGLLLIEIDGYLQGGEYDLLSIGGEADLGGTLEIDFGFTLTVNDLFTFLIASSIIGEFDTLLLPELAGINLAVIYGLDSVSLQVNAVPIPAAAWLFGSVFDWSAGANEKTACEKSKPGVVYAFGALR